MNSVKSSDIETFSSDSDFSLNLNENPSNVDDLMKKYDAIV